MAHWHDDSAMAKANDSQRERYFKEARRQIAHICKEGKTLWVRWCQAYTL